MPGISHAAVIFTNLGPNSAYNTQVGNVVGDDFVGDNLAEADTFTPLTSLKFGQLSIALACNNTACPDTYSVSLTQDSGAGTPGTVIESFVGSGLALGQIASTNPLNVFKSMLTPTLTAGTQYWVTVSTDLNNSISWNYNTSGDTSNQAISFDGGVTYSAPSFLTPGAYEVDSTAPVVQAVPEPGTLWMLAGGVALWAASRRASRRGSTAGFGA